MELNHPNIVRLMGWYEEPDVFYVPLELCEVRCSDEAAIYRLSGSCKSTCYFSCDSQFRASCIYYCYTMLHEQGGELFDRIVQKTFYTEREARDLVRTLLEALAYCHARNIMHR